MKDAPAQDAAPLSQKPRMLLCKLVHKSQKLLHMLLAIHPLQAEVPQHIHQPSPPLQQAAAQALQLAPHAVQDQFCPDRDFWVASRAEHERDRREREHQQKEDRRKDLENFPKMF